MRDRGTDSSRSSAPDSSSPRSSPCRREERPDADQRKNDGEPPGRVAAGTEHVHGLGEQADQRVAHQQSIAGARLRVGQQCRHQREDQRRQRADAQPPAEDRRRGNRAAS